MVLAPTRELALQVSSHLNACLNPVVDVHQTGSHLENKNKGQQNNAKSANGPPLVSVAAIVGGMSLQKQRRILDRGVDVLIATPGRLWDIMEDVSRTEIRFFF